MFLNEYSSFAGSISKQRDLIVKTQNITFHVAMKSTWRVGALVWWKAFSKPKVSAPGIYLELPLAFCFLKKKIAQVSVSVIGHKWSFEQFSHARCHLAVFDLVHNGFPIWLCKIIQGQHLICVQPSLGVLCVPPGIRCAVLTPDMHVVTEEFWTGRSER